MSSCRGESGQVNADPVFIPIAIAVVVTLAAAKGLARPEVRQLLWEDRANVLYVAAVAVADAALTWFLGWAPVGWGKRSGWPRRRVLALAVFLFFMALLVRAAWLAAQAPPS